MNRIERMVAEMCPDGVECQELGDLCHFQRGRWIKANQLIPGTVPVVTSAQEVTLHNSEANRFGENVVISSSGAYAGFVSYWDRPIYLSNAFTVHPNEGVQMLVRFLYFLLKSQQEKIYGMASAAGVPNVYGADIARLSVQVPPIEIQREIVDILDSFTKLEAELEAELEARKAQYSFLRNMLLNFEFSAKNVSVNLLGEEHFNVQEKRLGDIALIKTGRKFEGAFGSGLLPYVNGGVEPSGWVSCANNPGMVITIPSRGSVGIVGFQWDQFWLGPLCYAVTPKEGVDPRFLYHQLKRQQTRLVALQQTGSIPALNKKELVGFVIDVPPLYVQRRIADVLDDFDSLVNDLSSGLPAEIAARRQQYEYYRDRLLTFPEKK